MRQFIEFSPLQTRNHKTVDQNAICFMFEMLTDDIDIQSSASTSTYTVLLINKTVGTGHHETHAISMNGACIVNKQLYGALLEVLVCN